MPTPTGPLELGPSASTAGSRPAATPLSAGPGPRVKPAKQSTQADASDPSIGARPATASGGAGTSTPTASEPAPTAEHASLPPGASAAPGGLAAGAGIAGAGPSTGAPAKGSLPAASMSASPASSVAVAAGAASSGSAPAVVGSASSPSLPGTQSSPGGLPLSGSADPGPHDTAAGANPAGQSSVPTRGQYKDGTYSGWGTSRHGQIEAVLEVKNGRIVSASIAECLTRYSCSWISMLPPQVVERQSAEVDYVSGATQSANAFYFAVVDALSKAK